MESLCILGRQPALGLMELESLYGADRLHPITPNSSTSAALLQLPSSAIEFNRLGGSIKLASVLLTVPTTDLKQLDKHLRKLMPKIVQDMPEGKIQLGISAIGLHVTPAALMATGLTLKKVLRSLERSVRLVPNKELELNSASVLHNHLTGPTGCELLLVREGNDTIIARTVAVQDIDAYTLRDRERPKRDARVGMLPPKLAQIIINCATAQMHPYKDFTVLDPFCGTGVVLMEAQLMGFSATGSDIEQRMGDYTIANLDWLHKIYPDTESVFGGWQLGDATKHQWIESKVITNGDEIVDAEWVPMHIDAVACETYLGRPFTSLPSPELLQQTISECNLIVKKFLRNIAGQLEPGSRLCLAVPAWQVRPGQFKHLPLLNQPRTSSMPADNSSRMQTPQNLDSLEELGYNRIRFKYASDEQNLYYRPDQIVARELLVLVKR